MVGRTIAHYQILEKLGEGGMGVVYKARDTHLDRFVALKFLPPERISDPDRKRRFVQEAKAASALNHPNIIHIYDIDQQQGLDFIAMEYVAGKTLDRLIGRKGLALSEGLKCAVQIADALAKAHAAGIIHRDLKPSNLMVTGDGLGKVLDFGLAKLSEPVAHEETPTKTLMAEETPHTEEGTVLGTVAYMSPEQAEGKKLDARSDIFSFGAVLYEMLTGRRAFQRDSKLSTLAAILREEPMPASQIVAGLPAEAERIITRCLRKDPARRFQTMADLKVALEELKEESDSGKLGAPILGTRKRLPPWRVIAAAVIFVGVGVGTSWLLTRSQPRVPQVTFARLTDAPGQELYPSLSPDGKSLVYASAAAGNWDIYLLRVGGRTAINLTKDCTADDTQPAFSPDGERIAFRSDRDGGGIFVMGTTGESVKRLTDFGYHPAWSPDGKQIVCATTGFERPDIRYSSISQLFAVSVSTGQKRLLTLGITDAVQPHWSPHGHRISFWGFRRSPNRDIWTIPALGGTAVTVTDDAFLDWNPVWSPDGKYLYFASDRAGSTNLWRIPIDEKSGKVLGPPEPVTTPSPYSGYISLSADGRRIAYVQLTRTTNLQKARFDPATEAVVGPTASITQGAREIAGPDVSPDGQWVAFSQFGKQEDIWVIRTDGTSLRQLTDDIYRDRGARWSPDGKRIAFFSNRSGRIEIWVIHLDGSGLRQLTDAGCNHPIWSPDGTRMLTTVIPRTPVVLDPDKSWKEQLPRPLPALGEPNAWFQPWSWSLDGRKLAGYRQAEEGGPSGIIIYDFESRHFDRLSQSGKNPRWLPDGRRLLFHSQGEIHILDTSSRRQREVLSAAPHWIDDFFSLSRDGRLICFGLTLTEADVWLASLE